MRSPLKARKTCGTPCALAKSACSVKCNGSPCAGTAILRTHPGIHLRHLCSARMAGNMHQRSAVGHDLDARGDERVDDPSDRLFIAGNGARRKDHGVSGVQFGRRMVVPSDARKRRARLALAPGGEREDPVTRQALERIHAQQRRQSRRASRTRVRPQRPARSPAREYRPAVRRRSQPRPQREAGRRWKRTWSRSPCPSRRR